MALQGPGTLDFMFGDATDGDIAVTGTIALTRDMSVDTMTLSASGPQVPTVYTNSYRLFVRRLYAATSATFCNSGSSIDPTIGSLATAQAGYTFSASANAILSGNTIDVGNFKTWAGFGGNGGNGNFVVVSASLGGQGLPSALSGGIHGFFELLTGFSFGNGGRPFPIYGGGAGGAGASDTLSTPGFHAAHSNLPLHDGYFPGYTLFSDVAPSNTNAAVAFVGTQPNVKNSTVAKIGPYKGIYRTTNRGASWTQLTGGVGGYAELPRAAFVFVAMDSIIPNMVYGVGYMTSSQTTNNAFMISASFFRSSNNGSTWTTSSLSQSLLGNANMYMWGFRPSPVSSTLYMSVSSQGGSPGYLLRSTDTGSSWQIIFSGTSFPLGLQMDRAENMYVYNGLSGSWQRSQTKGTVWTTVTGLPQVVGQGLIGGPSNYSYSLFASATGSVVLAVAGTGGLYRSINGGNSFTSILGRDGVSGTFVAVASDPNNLRNVTAISIQGGVSLVFRSTDAGTTFVNETSNVNLTGTSLFGSGYAAGGVSSAGIRMIYSPVTGSVQWFTLQTALYERDTDSGPGANGGNGGGVILVAARDIVASGAITFDVSGAPGENAALVTNGAGGGGGGGMVLLSAASVTGTLTYNLSGGLPGTSLTGGVSGTAGTTGSAIVYTMA